MKLAGHPRHTRPRRRVLVLGGARSGKSAYAEGLLAHAASVVYVATGMVPSPADPEWAARVQAHRDRRPRGWSTAETQDLASVLSAPGPPALVDDLSTWLAAAMDAADVWADAPGSDAALAARVAEFVAAWFATRRTVIAVSAEVGQGLVPATSSGRRFRDELGRLNAAIAAGSDEVWFVTAGLPRRLKP
jgi:adenosylcobinamide kinase / adenosylcobinamide-phosphate guanylyltransferase